MRLALFLTILMLPFAVWLIIELYNSTKMELSFSLASRALDDLLEDMRTTMAELKMEYPLQNAVYIKEDGSNGAMAYFHDGQTRKFKKLSCHDFLPNNFIQYTNHQCVNRHWIQKIKADKLELLNGEMLYKKKKF